MYIARQETCSFYPRNEGHMHHYSTQVVGVPYIRYTSSVWQPVFALWCVRRLKRIPVSRFPVRWSLPDRRERKQRFSYRFYLPWPCIRCAKCMRWKFVRSKDSSIRSLLLPLYLRYSKPSSLSLCRFPRRTKGRICLCSKAVLSVRRFQTVSERDNPDRNCQHRWTSNLRFGRDRP